MYSPLVADISSNNSEFDAAEYHGQGHVMVAIKATEGPRHHYLNPEHRTWCLHAGFHHVAVMHYHFARPDLGTDPADEANWFLDCVLPLAGPRDYLVNDIERATPRGFEHDPEWSVRFDQRIQERSRFAAILYANKSTLQISDRWLIGPKKRVWEADWSTEHDYAPPGYECVMRQFTDGVFGPGPHSLPGVGQCDISRMNHRMFAAVCARQRPHHHHRRP